MNTADSQVAYSLSGTVTTFSGPRGVAVSPDGTVYVADVTNHRVVRITGSSATLSGGAVTGTGAALAPTGVTLSGPVAVALDSAGVLYIADTAGHQVVKMTAPESSNAASTIAYTATRNPVALATDPNTNALFIADETANAIYKVASGGTTGTKLTLSAANLKPIGLAVDSASSLFFADATNNEIFKQTSGGTNSVYLNITGTNAFRFSTATAPVGLDLDPTGNLYTLDNGGTDRIFEIPPVATATASTTIWYFVPISNLQAGTLSTISLAVDSIGNILVTDDGNNALDKLYYNNPVDFGRVNAGSSTATVTANFAFNAATTGLTNFQSVHGDYTGEFVATTTCGTTQAAASTCTSKYHANYQSATPGPRLGALGFFSTSATVNPTLTALVNGTSVAGALSLFPGAQSKVSTSTTLWEPQGMVVTGGINTSTSGSFNGSLIVADEGGDLSKNPPTYTHGNVYQYTIGAGAISAGGTAIGSLPTPLSVALDPAGDLFVADYSGSIYVFQPKMTGAGHVITWPGFTNKKLTLPTGVTLNHPMALAFDALGNLYIGDMGPLGTVATVSSPGYIVKVPAGPLACGASTCTVGGPAAFKLTNTSIGGTAIVFPQYLVTDATNNLFIADGGDINGVDAGGVDVLPASGASAYQLAITGLDQPTGLNLDAANDLYIVDSYNQRILEAQITGTTTPVVSGSVVALGQNTSGNGASGFTSTFITPTAMAVWPGGQNITVADIGYPPANPVQLLNLSTFNSKVNAPSGAPADVNDVNVGNQTITFNAATSNTSQTCVGGVVFLGLCLGGNYVDDFTLTGCGKANNSTLGTGVSNTCVSTVTNQTGTTSGNGIFTLNGKGSTNSALGNQIQVDGTPNGPALQLFVPVFNFGFSDTATVTNIGTGTLTINSIAVTGQGNRLGGTCAVGTNLNNFQSCTIHYSFTGIIGTVTVSVGTNGGNGNGTEIFFF